MHIEWSIDRQLDCCIPPPTHIPLITFSDWVSECDIKLHSVCCLHLKDTPRWAATLQFPPPTPSNTANAIACMTTSQTDRPPRLHPLGANGWPWHFKNRTVPIQNGGLHSRSCHPIWDISVSGRSCTRLADFSRIPKVLTNWEKHCPLSNDSCVRSEYRVTTKLTLLGLVVFFTLYYPFP